MHVARVADGVIGPWWGRDLAGRSGQGDGAALGFSRAAVGLVTAQTAALLAWHHVDEAPHGVQRALLFIEQLEVQRHTRRRTERNRAVLLHGHCADQTFHAFRLDRRDDRAGGDVGALVPISVSLGVYAEDAQELRLAAQFRGRALIDTAGEDHAVRRVFAFRECWPRNAVLDDRRLRPRLERHGVQHLVRAFVDQFAVALHVHQVKHKLASAVC